MRRLKVALFAVGLGVLATPLPASADHTRPVQDGAQRLPNVCSRACNAFIPVLDPDCRQEQPADFPYPVDHTTGYDGDCSGDYGD